MKINIKVSYKLISKLGIKVGYRVIVLMGMIKHIGEHQNFCKLTLSFFDGSSQTCSKYQKNKLIGIFLRCL